MIYGIGLAGSQPFGFGPRRRLRRLSPWRPRRRGQARSRTPEAGARQRRRLLRAHGDARPVGDVHPCRRRAAPPVSDRVRAAEARRQSPQARGAREGRRPHRARPQELRRGALTRASSSRIAHRASLGSFQPMTADHGTRRGRLRRLRQQRDQLQEHRQALQASRRLQQRRRPAAGFHPSGVKKSGPSGGANLNGAPAAATMSPPCAIIIFTSPGDARSVIQVWKRDTAARSRASDATSSGDR